MQVGAGGAVRGVELEHTRLLCPLFAGRGGCDGAEAAHAVRRCHGRGAIAGTAGGVRRGPAARPSLTPVATQRLWNELVAAAAGGSPRRRHCRPLRAVFYAATDWLRLATKLAATASPCAQYYVSVPPLAARQVAAAGEPGIADPRARAGVPRARGDQRHRLDGWVASTGSSWYQAGVEARRRMAAAGYDVTAGDTWALNELSSAVRQGTGNARANMRGVPQRPLRRRRHVARRARRRVRRPGSAQATTDLSLYQARLQDWYEDQRSGATWAAYVERLVAGGLRRRAQLRHRGREPGDAARPAERVPPAPERARGRRAAVGRRRASFIGRPTARSRTRPGATTPPSAGRTSRSS